MHHPNQRPRFPQGNMPRFPSPSMAHQGPGGMMRGPWPQRFGPPRPDMTQRFPPGRFPGPPRNMGPNFNTVDMMPNPNHQPMCMNPHNNQQRPYLNRPLLPAPNNQHRPQLNRPLGPPPYNQQKPNFNRPLGPHVPPQNRPAYNLQHIQHPNRASSFEEYYGSDSNQQIALNHKSGKLVKEKKKPKIDKRTLPENNVFFCDMCDRGFKDENQYQGHVDQHEKCPEPGCVYVAARKLVQLHQKQHACGLAKKVWSLESPEDIQKWREERKRHFPTAETVAKRKAIDAEKIARGEVIEEKYFGKMRGRGRGNFNNRGRGRGRGGRGGQPQNNRESMNLKRKISKDEEGEGDSLCSPGKQRKEGSDGTEGVGTDALAMFFCNTETEGDSDKDSEPDETSSATPVTAAGALGKLMALYQDSGSEDEENMEVEKSNNTGTNEGRKAQTKERMKDSREYQHGNTKKHKKRSKKGNKRDLPSMVNKSLLEKLLAKEIRQERNRILQCVHFVVKNNFFDKPDTNKPDT